MSIKTLLIFACSLSLSYAISQDEIDNGLDFNRIIDQKDIWAMEFGSSSLLNSKISTSRINFVTGLDYFYEWNLNSSNSISVATGIGYRYSSQSFNGIFENQLDSISGASYTSYSNPTFVTKSRLNNHFVRIPVELRFWIKQKVKIYLGYSIGVNARLKNKYRTANEKLMIRDYKDAYLVSNSVKLRIGMGDVFLFAAYNFTTPFIASNSPKFNILEFGISFGG